MASADIAALLLRCTVGAFMLPHGFQKFGLLGGDRAFEVQAFDSLGLRPGAAWANFAGIAQLGLGLLLVIGLFTPLAATATAVFMLAAAWIALRKNGWVWLKYGMEYTVFWSLAALCVVLFGPGQWSLDQAFLRRS